ncbi:hypothetical protein AABB24_017716 [Solanum stoloniferum]|uniref:Uncharacterized protein n=1 Tax=Solanum stoloniferum TaxID=62892 RepID=A0ABD2TM16_9SOLN
MGQTHALSRCCVCQRVWDRCCTFSGHFWREEEGQQGSASTVVLTVLFGLLYCIVTDLFGPGKGGKGLEKKWVGWCMLWWVLYVGGLGIVVEIGREVVELM